MYTRILEEKIKKYFFKGKVLILVGPRQVGKTTLIEKIISKYPEKEIVKFNGDDIEDRQILNVPKLTSLNKFIGDSKIVFIDEGQKIENIGNSIKLLVDKYKTTKQIIVTGSSSINILDMTSEPLTGRKFTYELFPISFEELVLNEGFKKSYLDLNDLLIFGSYPEVLLKKSIEEKNKVLKELAKSYLYKDILEFQSIKQSDIIVNLLKLLAFQLGKEVSINELSNKLNISIKEVEKYINLFEKSYIIFRLPPYSKNQRREITKMNKVYFYDLGMRNIIINNLNSMNNRNDVGELFENFVILERLKKRQYHEILSSQYFWRTYDGSEVDLVEEREGKLFGYEIKWNEKRSSHKPSKWLEYKNASFEVITRENLFEFI